MRSEEESDEYVEVFLASLSELYMWRKKGKKNKGNGRESSAPLERLSLAGERKQYSPITFTLFRFLFEYFPTYRKYLDFRTRF